MSQYSKAGWIATYNNAAGPFNNSATGGVTGLTLQQFSQDAGDTFVTYDSLFNADILFQEADDFMNSVSGWVSSASGAGSNFQASLFGQDSTEKAFGVVALTTGTTSAGYAYQYKLAQIKLGFGHAVTLRFRVAAEVLSTLADRYTMYLGIGDAINGVEHSNGAYFKYNDSINSGNFQCLTANAGTRTTTNTSVAQTTLYKTFEIKIDGAAASAIFSIDGAVVATISTNMPSNVLVFPCVLGIVKSAGTTARLMDTDYYSLLVTRTSAR